MKKLKYKDPYKYDLPAEVQKIVKVFADRGYQISEIDALRAWEEYSASVYVGWASLNDTDQHIFEKCFIYFDGGSGEKTST